MNKLTLLSIILLMSSTLFAQNVPITFEDNENGADWTWTVFENDDNPSLEVVTNPSSDAVNSSATVAKFTARANGQPYAGCESLHGADIGDYKITSENSTITIMVYKSVTSDVGIKLVTASGWSKGELKVANTKVNEWEKLTFDFSGVDHEDMTYDQIVVFPDFRDRSEEAVVYFDNITIGDEEVNSVQPLSTVDVTLYPNPSSKSIHINNASNLDIRSMSISSLDGREVLNVNGTDRMLDITNLSSGLYTVTIQASEGTYYQKIIVE